MPNKYALIFWIESKQSDVIDASKIPTSGKKVGAVTKLLWNDKTKNLSKYFDAKIVKMDGKCSDMIL